ncbi:MAG: hypothetical protein Q7K28_02830 [Candidatus Wildermuthbacteria bacterium]|nr:hypothetical protein [Candidatus Wildermuthbacteria bacterium]
MTNENIETVAGFLDLALDIEDQMSRSVYGEFLQRKAWPANLEEDVFEAISASLMILIKETEEHRLEFLNLKKKLEND